MLVIGDTIITDDIKDSYFVCNLDKCKGGCCVEGELGAPLDENELPVLEEIYEKVKPYLSRESIEAIEKQGKYVFDEDKEFSTPTLSGKECAYAVYGKDGILKCGIEKAYSDGKIDFQKPISCHLYPIRITELGNSNAINYDKWSICSDACVLGEKLNVPLYKFVKDALIRRFGHTWYAELEKEIESSLIADE